MASANLNIEIKVHMGFTGAILRCAAGMLKATTPIEYGIESSAMRALCELQDMSAKARLDLGLIDIVPVVLELRFSTSTT